MIRPIRLTDIHLAKRQQQLLPLNFPDDLVRPFSPVRFAARSMFPPLRSHAETLLYTRGMRAIACCYSTWDRRGENARLLALSLFGTDPDTAETAWERLVERACLRAAGNGKLRVLARAEQGSDVAHLLYRAGFTTVTDEQVYQWSGGGEVAGASLKLDRLKGEDAWDVWRLYNQTEPSIVQRAEGLTPSSWWRGRRLRRKPYQEWILRDTAGVAVHQELLYGVESAALTFHYRPSHSPAVGAALDHAVAFAKRRRTLKLYCSVREHQSELPALLLERGFTPVRSQVRLVLYTSVLSYASEPNPLPSAERRTAMLDTPITTLPGRRDHASKGRAD